MRKYELIYIVKPQEEEAIEALVAKFDGIITDNGGTIEKTDRWGKRRLAYPIQDLTEGYYVLQHLVAEPAVINEPESAVEAEAENVLPGNGLDALTADASEPAVETEASNTQAYVDPFDS